MILDYRGNPGGYTMTKMEIMKLIESLETPGGKYVLIDGGSASATVAVSVVLRRFCKDVVLVGAPTGEPPNKIFAVNSFTSPNQYLYGGVSVRECQYWWPERDDPALTPDIPVFQTLEDYKKGIDTVLNYVLNGIDE